MIVSYCMLFYLNDDFWIFSHEKTFSSLFLSQSLIYFYQQYTFFFSLFQWCSVDFEISYCEQIKIYTEKDAWNTRMWERVCDVKLSKVLWVEFESKFWYSLYSVSIVMLLLCDVRYCVYCIWMSQCNNEMLFVECWWRVLMIFTEKKMLKWTIFLIINSLPLLSSV